MHDVSKPWEQLLCHLNLVVCVRAFYLLAAIAILIVRFVPFLKDRFLDYGPRATQNEEGADSTLGTPGSLFSRFLDTIAELKVSHSRFIDFYILSLLCSLFWLFQIRTESSVVQELRSASSQPINQDVSGRITLCLIILALQSSRRLYECINFSKPSSSSTMWVGHYMIGVAFYFLIYFAVLVDQVDAPTAPTQSTTSSTSSQTFMFNSDAAALAIFAMASMKQHQSHAYLFSLKKYTLPDEHAFQYIVAPHYTAECFIYLSLSILAAPPGYFINGTVFCALLFVIVNLSVTADGAKRWILKKFPDREVEIEKRARIIPTIF